MRRHSPNEDPEVEGLILEMQRDGLPMPAATMLHAVEDPDWRSTRRTHDWRAYVPPSLRRRWVSLPLPTRLCVFGTAELVALEEESATTMVTGPAYPRSGP
jgi:hypothetical protein